MKQILLEEMQTYTRKDLNDYAYLTSSDVDQFYAVIVIANIRDKRIVSTVLVTRIVDTTNHHRS